MGRVQVWGKGTDVERVLWCGKRTGIESEQVQGEGAGAGKVAGVGRAHRCISAPTHSSTPVTLPPNTWGQPGSVKHPSFLSVLLPPP